MNKYVIRLWPEIPTWLSAMWVSDFDGDPGRTFEIESAKKYKTEKGAKSALTQIRNRYSRSFPQAVILQE